MSQIRDALEGLTKKLSDQEQNRPFSFDEFLGRAAESPEVVFRNIFQLFYDMVHHYVPHASDTFSDDPELMDFVDYDCAKLLVEGMDEPFFADRLFANRLINLVNSFKQGTQQNKVYLFEGPPGSGKSIFLNNLLQRLEEYSRTAEGTTYETIWRLDVERLGGFPEKDIFPVVHSGRGPFRSGMGTAMWQHPEQVLDVPCPNHDHPILQVPKEHRKKFLDKLITDEQFKEKLFGGKEYEWVFRDEHCTICHSLYSALLEKVDFSEVLKMIFARRYNFNRMVGEGVSIFNPSDLLPREGILTNEMQQSLLNNLLRDSNRVPYTFSQFARTNNGVYALMDIKGDNELRFRDLHGIVTDGVHKVGSIEERTKSLFLGVNNPEDRDSFEKMESFGDRIEFVPCNYVLNYNTELDIYRSKFGKEFGKSIDEFFLPGVLEIFAKIVISTRLRKDLKQIEDWITGPKEKYENYCDENLLLLKMDLYAGRVPSWLSEEDKRSLTLKTRKKILAASLSEGKKGFSGRRSIQLFEDFLSKYSKTGKLITTQMVYDFLFFSDVDHFRELSEEFVDSLVRLYDYQVAGEIKESLYDYNEDLISMDIQNYLFAIDYDVDTTQVCPYTGDKLVISQEFFDRVEQRIFGKIDASEEIRLRIRQRIQNEILQTMLKDQPLTETDMYETLYNYYTENLKRNVLEPFLNNESFNFAVRDFGTPKFRTYDKRVQQDVAFLISNLQEKFGYTEEGAQQVTIYALDKGIADN